VGALNLAVISRQESREEAVQKEKEARERERRRKAKEIRTCQECGNVFPKKLEGGVCVKCAGGNPEKRHTILKEVKQSVMEREGWTCYYCGKDLSDADYHFDHFIPHSYGGEEVEENIVLSCPVCNQGKSDKVPSDREQIDFAWYRFAKQAGASKKSQILALANANDNGRNPKQKDIARILRTSQGYVSSVVKENLDNA
jgi:5-methylcytosine-specific restriction endonuclease McrA